MNDEAKIEVLAPGALAELHTSEIEAQLAAAEKRPRVISAFMDSARSMATQNAKVAALCFYRLRRGGNVIEGPSVRMAEIVQATYRNLRVASRVRAIDATHVIAEGAVHDLESNLLVQREVRRRITDRNGKRYSEDMIQTTAQAAISLALRNAVFSVVPRVLIGSLLEDVKAASLGKGTMEDKRELALGAYKALGVEVQDALRLVGARRREDLDEERLLDLRGFYTSIRDGEETVESILAEREEEAARIERKPPRSRTGSSFFSQSAAQAEGGMPPVIESEVREHIEQQPQDTQEDPDGAVFCSACERRLPDHADGCPESF